MRRTPALLALLAVLSFALAAGGAGSVDPPALGVDAGADGARDGPQPRNRSQAERGQPPDTDDGDRDLVHTAAAPPEGEGGDATVPAWALGVAAAAVGGGLVAALLLTDGDEAALDPPEPTGAASGDGRSAVPRPEYRTPGDAEVYRAWERLTAAVDAPPTASPREVAAAAVDSGLPDDAVEEVTALFRAVRYGPADPDPDREARARDARRRLEGER